MTLFDVEELTAYWAEHPPVHILMGAYLGAGKPQRSRIPSVHSGLGRAASSDLKGIVAELGPGFGTGDVHHAVCRGWCSILPSFGTGLNATTAVRKATRTARNEPT